MNENHRQMRNESAQGVVQPVPAARRFSIDHFLAVFNARNREFIRDRSSWVWNLVFPVMLIGGLAVMFGNEDRAEYKIGVFPTTHSADPFFNLRHMQFVEVASVDTAVVSVERHQLDLLLDTKTNRYWVNTTSA